MQTSRFRPLAAGLCFFGALAALVWIFIGEPPADDPAAEADLKQFTDADGASLVPAPASEARPPDFERQTLDPQQLFLDRWRELNTSEEFRRRIHGPRQKQLEELRRTHGELPFEDEANRLGRAGVVPPPPRETFSDLILEEMDHARGRLQSQADSFRAFPLQAVSRWKEREASTFADDSISQAPEVVAAYLLERDIREDLMENDALRLQLAEIRARGIRAYAQAWEEYQWARFCLHSACRELGIEFLTGTGANEAYATMLPEYKLVLDRLANTHANYLAELRAALQLAYPNEMTF